MSRLKHSKRHRFFVGLITAGFSTLRAAEFGAAIAVASLLPRPASAAPQESVLYSFPGNRIGYPEAGLVMDANGALYGTASGRSGRRCFGSVGCGTVFRLAPPGPGGSGWSETVLHRFKAGDDGTIPRAALIMDATGALYGTTSLGGRGNCSLSCGTVFKLTPPAAGGSWSETVLYRFRGGADGALPETDLTMDANGALYGTTTSGGISCSGKFVESCGTVFKLTPPAAGERRWAETVLHRFRGGADGAYPLGGLIMDANGALYGTTSSNGGGGPCSEGCGTVFALTPPASGESGWTETVLYRFQGGADGSGPQADLIMDAAGNLYGTTYQGGSCRFISGCGTVFKLTPPAASGGSWTETVLYDFKGGADGLGPQAGLIMDAIGALYSTTLGGGSAGWGNVFQLTPPAAGTGDWTLKVLYSFTVGTDGYLPLGGVIMDANGALFGTTDEGGNAGRGTVFKLVP